MARALRLTREKLHVPVCFPMRINFLQQLSDTRIVCRCDYLFSLFVQGIPHFQYGQSSLLAALCSSCFHSPHVPFYTMCILLFPCSRTSPFAARKGMCQSLPEATFSAVAMVWTCFLTIFLPLLCLTLLGGGSPCSKYAFIFIIDDLVRFSRESPSHLTRD